MLRLGKARFRSLASGLLGALCLAGAAAAQSDVQILKLEIDGGQTAYTQSGLAVSDRHLVSADTGYSARRPDGEAQLNGAIISVTAIAHDPDARLVLWEAASDTFEPSTFAQGFAAEGEPIGLIYAAPAGTVRIEGRVADTDADRPLVQMDTTRAFSSFGGAVVNPCGEVIGLNAPGADYGTRALRRQDALPAGANVLSLSSLRAFLSLSGVAVETAAGPCLSEVERARQEAADAEARERAQLEETEELRGRAEAAANRAAELEARAKELEEAAERGEAEARAEAEAAREAAELAQAEAEGAAADLTDAERELAELGNALDEAEAELERNETALAEAEGEIETANETASTWQRYAYIALAGVVLVAVVGAFLMWRRGQTLKAEQSTRQAAEAEAERLAAIPKAIPAVADARLENEARALILPGALLPEAAGGVSVGRNPDLAQVLLEGEDVSRQHARFFEIDGAVFVEDLGSSFGTKVNGKAMAKGAPQRLSNGDTLQLASHTFTFRRTA